MVTGSLGRLDDAIAEITLALDLDPFGVTVNHDLGLLLYASRRYGEARLRLRHTLEIAPTSYWAKVYLALTCLELTEYDEALESAAVQPALRACVRARMGDSRDALRLSELSRAGPSATWRALLYVALGQYERAASWLSRAVERHEPEFLNMRIVLRGHPRFEEVRTSPGSDRIFPEG
jgi:tetratricopeptide (TPR) repeat protein